MPEFRVRIVWDHICKQYAQSTLHMTGWLHMGFDFMPIFFVRAALSLDELCIENYYYFSMCFSRFCTQLDCACVVCTAIVVHWNDLYGVRAAGTQFVLLYKQQKPKWTSAFSPLMKNEWKIPLMWLLRLCFLCASATFLVYSEPGFWYCVFEFCILPFCCCAPLRRMQTHIGIDRIAQRQHEESNSTEIRLIYNSIFCSVWENTCATAIFLGARFFSCSSVRQSESDYEFINKKYVSRQGDIFDMHFHFGFRILFGDKRQRTTIRGEKNSFPSLWRIELHRN